MVRLGYGKSEEVERERRKQALGSDEYMITRRTWVQMKVFLSEDMCDCVQRLRDGKVLNYREGSTKRSRHGSMNLQFWSP